MLAVGIPLARHHVAMDFHNHRIGIDYELSLKEVGQRERKKPS